MLDNLVVSLVVLAAAGYLGYLAWRKVRGKRGCCEDEAPKKPTVSRPMNLTIGGKRPR